MQIIPLSNMPAQTISVTLGGQYCQINTYQKRTGLYFDLSVAGVLVVAGVLCLNATVLVRAPYLGFSGDLAFFDTQGSADPDYAGVGARFLLFYLSSDEVSSLAATALANALAAEAAALATVTGTDGNFSSDFDNDFS